MLDLTTIITTLIATLTAGGWLMSSSRRRKEAEEHRVEMEAKKAELYQTIRESETKYTREALEIYTQQVVEPLREQLNRNTAAIERYQGAIDKAPECRIFPDCVILRSLQGNKDDHDPC